MTGQSKLDTVNSLVSALGLKVARQVDEIYFIEHNLFLVIDSREEGLLLLCFNSECSPDKAALAALTLYAKAQELGIDLGLSGSYTMETLPGHEVKLHLHPQQTVKESPGSNGMTH